MRNLFLFFILLVSFQSNGQIFTEALGSVGGTTTIAAHETSNGFDNDSYTMTGTGDLRTTTASSGYSGATGGANVYLTSNGTAYFQIAGITTLTCSSLSLSFGAHKSTTASNMSELQLEYSTDGSTFNTISIPLQPTGSGTANWRLITISLPAAAENQSNLRLRWTNTGNTDPQFRIDDIRLIGTCVTNTITTVSVLTSPFNINCNTAATGTVTFTSTGTFNTSNIYTAQLSDQLGDFTSPTNIGTLNSTANSGTISIIIPIGTSSGTLYRIRVVSDDPATVGTDNGTNLTITNNCSITTGVVSSYSFSVSCSAGTNGTVDFIASATMQAGNLYSAQLSDASGNFTASTTIGTLNSTVSSGTISFTIPASIPTGSGYLIRVIASNPSTTGTSSSVITITLTDGPCVQEPPHLTSVIINSCDPTCDEGYNEIVFGTSGDYSFNVNTSNFDFLYGSTNPGTNYTDVIVNNAVGINQLNTAAGCSGLFVDALGTTVPPDASWMLVYTDICEEALTWSGLCGSGPIYVIFQNDANWLVSGNFANDPSVASPLRYFRTGITTTSGSTFTINYTIDGNQYPNSDGVYATFDSDGGAATAYGDNNCILSPTLLPSSLISFNGTYIQSSSELTWQTSSEQNNSHFTLTHSIDGKKFSPIGTVAGAGNSSELLNYRYVHSFPHPGMNYYKLQSTDYDGTTYEKGIVAVKAEFSFSFYDPLTATIELFYESDIEIYSTDGKLIEMASETKSIPFNQSGLFFILDKRSGITERLFVP